MSLSLYQTKEENKQASKQASRKVSFFVQYFISIVNDDLFRQNYTGSFQK